MFEDKTLYVKQLKPYLYLFDENHECTGYLVIGDKKAALIDTMMGYHNYKEEIKKITDKPVMVINTHGHPDHIYGNVFFDEAYISPGDLDLAIDTSKDPEFVEVCEEEGFSMPPFKEIKGGDVVDLGGKTLEIYDIPSHTPGGILLLLKEDRILFTGDAINHHLWLQLPHTVSYEKCIEGINKVLFLEKEADVILHGHARDYDDISLMRCVRDAIQEILDGKNDADTDYTWFMGVCKQHPFKVEAGKHYQQEDHVIVYDQSKLS
ncbi:Glyoxylase, beta-lactamase superfamily II [Butyrivibrio fibrisolvens]|uniref:Glyoxylase, beta-lactamase superfamily II n=1 Tax=Butyrivibrio fibrisolvens TaxID=831 RepID=A0A1H9SDM4_BUTFI|nr:MBL fold metallo-hydrolase [Butyrivibrio fibrisolvens]SER83094.1 Glyoxylase, beta-lactamase superfamily II [Butyrivibrio fibrisolvens]